MPVIDWRSRAGGTAEFTPRGRHLSPGGAVKTPDGVMTKPVMAWTKKDIGVKDKEIWERTGLWPSHAYAVLGVMDSGHIVLRDPHGRATERRRGYAEGPWQITARRSS